MLTNGVWLSLLQSTTDQIFLNSSEVPKILVDSPALSPLDYCISRLDMGQNTHSHNWKISFVYVCAQVYVPVPLLLQMCTYARKDVHTELTSYDFLKGRWTYFIDCWFVDNLLGTFGISQRTQCLCIMTFCRTDG